MENYSLDDIIQSLEINEKLAQKNFNNNIAINLKKYSTSPRIGDSGTSTRPHADVWFNLPKGNALFKTQDNAYQNFYAWNEIICNLLCKQINLPCADYEFAYFGNNEYGTISYNFLKRNESLITGKYFLSKYAKTHRNTFENYRKAFENLKNDNPHFKFDIEEIMFGLYKILLFDYITSQIDRHYYNISFIVRNDNLSTLKLSPLFDNEMAFGVYNQDTLSNFLNFSNKKDIINYLPLVCFSPTNKATTQESLASEIIKLTMSNNRYKNYYNYVMQNLNLEQAFSEIYKKGAVVPHVQMVWYKYAIEVKKELLIEAEKQYNLSNTNNCEEDMQL